MIDSSPCKRRPPWKTTKGKSDETADATALTYLLTYSSYFGHTSVEVPPCCHPQFLRNCVESLWNSVTLR